MEKVCPQRIIAEAVNLLTYIDVDELQAMGFDVTVDRLENCQVALEGLAKALARDGIISIEEMKQ